MIRAENGNITMAFLLGTLIALSIVFFVYSTNNMIDKKVYGLIYTHNLESIKGSTLAIIHNRQAQVPMLDFVGNGNLKQCLTNPAFDCPNVPNPLTLFTPDGQILIGTDPNDGFSRIMAPNGNFVCSTFLTAGAICPFKYNFVWFPDCPSGPPCFGRPITIQGRLVISPELNFVINPDRFKIDFNFEIKI